MAADDAGVPVWVWLPGATEPVEAASLRVADGSGRWQYAEAYASRRDAVSLDPRQLHLTSSRRGVQISHKDGLPGVVRDAMPAGYGADRLDAGAERKLTPLELLELGVPDSCGAIEVCRDMQRKLDWVPHQYSQLKDIIALLRADEPASRAIRTLNDDASTSAGGERPKVTIQDEGCMYLVKMQARSDIAFLPNKEFVVMSMANSCDINTPRVRLEQVGEHTVYLCQRFDRAGDPRKPARSLYASAHTVLRLDIDAVKGDPKRSYLGLADEMRVWCRSSPRRDHDLQELWRRMVFNALVGNSDDHPKNHGLLFEEGCWGLAPAFDITPLVDFKGVLSMATGADGSSAASAERFLAASERFGVSVEDAGAWLKNASTYVAGTWEGAMRETGVNEAEIRATESAFSFALKLASEPADLERLVAEAMVPRKRTRRPQLRVGNS